MTTRKIIVAVSGASGSVYARLLLEKLAGSDPRKQETALIFSGNANAIWEYELGEQYRPPEHFRLYDNSNLFAALSSGSSDWDSMIICPASMGVLGRIAGGISNDLITRAADVMLKEGRKLIVVPREMPYSLIHLRNMTTLLEAGAIICPANPSFYGRPESVRDLALTVVERILMLAGVEGDYKRWEGEY